MMMAAVSEAIRTTTTIELEHRVLQVDGTEGCTFSRDPTPRRERRHRRVVRGRERHHRAEASRASPARKRRAVRLEEAAGAEWWGWPLP